VLRNETPLGEFQNLKQCSIWKHQSALQPATSSVVAKAFGHWGLETWNFRNLVGRSWLNILEMRSVEHCEHAR
jgi:hypothetical protein